MACARELRPDRYSAYSARRERVVIRAAHAPMTSTINPLTVPTMISTTILSSSPSLVPAQVADVYNWGARKKLAAVGIERGFIRIAPALQLLGVWWQV